MERTRLARESLGPALLLLSPGRNILGHSNLLRLVEQAFPRERWGCGGVAATGAPLYNRVADWQRGGCSLHRPDSCPREVCGRAAQRHWAGPVVWSKNFSARSHK